VCVYVCVCVCVCVVVVGRGGGGGCVYIEEHMKVAGVRRHE
jgi:hypothetical protein